MPDKFSLKGQLRARGLILQKVYAIFLPILMGDAGIEPATSTV